MGDHGTGYAETEVLLDTMDALENGADPGWFDDVDERLTHMTVDELSRLREACKVLMARVVDTIQCKVGAS
jgi:hypothetical protein